MNETDAMTLLAKANPVQPDDVMSLDAPERLGRRRPNRPLILVAVAAGAAAAVLVGTFAFGGSGPSSSLGPLPGPTAPTGPTGAGGPVCPTPGDHTVGPTGPIGPPTLDDPLGGGKQVSLETAAAALGAPIVLPDTTAVSSADAGNVWLLDGHIGMCGVDEGPAVAVAVTFPKQGFWIVYFRKSQKRTYEYDNALAYYRSWANARHPNNRIVVANGRPALVFATPDKTLVEFHDDGTDISVAGNPDHSMLVSVAESIANRSDPIPPGQLGAIAGLQLYPYMPPTNPVALADLSATLGARVVLPDPALVDSPSAPKARAGGTCPHPDATPPIGQDGVDACWLWISYPGTSLSVGYFRPPFHGMGRENWRYFANESTVLSSKLVELDNSAPAPVGPTGALVGPPGGSGPFPVPAVVFPQQGALPGWLQFDIDGNLIVVGGDYDAATLQAVAQSIVDGFQPK